MPRVDEWPLKGLSVHIIEGSKFISFFTLGSPLWTATYTPHWGHFLLYITLQAN